MAILSDHIRTRKGLASIILLAFRREASGGSFLAILPFICFIGLKGSS